MCNGIGSMFKTSEQNEKDMWYKEKVLEIEKKIEITNPPPYDWPWFEHFHNIFLIL
jgi:hypothetical protein